MSRFLAHWGPLDVALLAALLVSLHVSPYWPSGKPSGPPRSHDGTPVYTVHQVVTGLVQQPARWFGRTVWVWGAWVSICPPYPHAGCAGPLEGQPYYYLAASAMHVWPTSDVLPLLEYYNGNPDPRWAAQERSGQPALYHVHIPRPGPSACAATGILGSVLPSCLGAELQG